MSSSASDARGDARGEGATFRAFLAVVAPPPVVRAWSDVRAELSRTLPGIRWVAPENLHLTLRFLGETSETTASRLQESAFRIASEGSPCRLAVGGLGVFGSRRSPRVVWLGLEGEIEPVRAIRRKLEDAVRELGFSADADRWAPHLTIGRARSAAVPPAESIEAHDRFLSSLFGAEFPMSDIRLIRSQLPASARGTAGPAGPVYTEVWRVPLGSA